MENREQSMMIVALLYHTVRTDSRFRPHFVGLNDGSFPHIGMGSVAWHESLLKFVNLIPKFHTIHIDRKALEKTGKRVSIRYVHTKVN